MLMKADPLKQRKINTMFQVKETIIQEQVSKQEAFKDIEDFGENEDDNVVEIRPRPMVTKKRKRENSPLIFTTNWKETIGPSPPATDIKVNLKFDQKML